MLLQLRPGGLHPGRLPSGLLASSSSLSTHTSCILLALARLPRAGPGRGRKTGVRMLSLQQLGLQPLHCLALLSNQLLLLAQLLLQQHRLGILLKLCK